MEVVTSHSTISRRDASSRDPSRPNRELHPSRKVRGDNNYHYSWIMSRVEQGDFLLTVDQFRWWSVNLHFLMAAVSFAVFNLLLHKVPSALLQLLEYCTTLMIKVFRRHPSADLKPLPTFLSLHSLERTNLLTFLKKLERSK